VLVIVRVRLTVRVAKLKLTFLLHSAISTEPITVHYDIYTVSVCLKKNMGPHFR